MRSGYLRIGDVKCKYADDASPKCPRLSELYRACIMARNINEKTVAFAWWLSKFFLIFLQGQLRAFDFFQIYVVEDWYPTATTKAINVSSFLGSGGS